MNHNVNVFVRIRPQDNLSARSIFENVKDKKIIIAGKPFDRVPKKYVFDKVFHPSTTQEVIFNHVMIPVINDVLDGFNCTVFAYGQSGTGKTFTIEGQNSNSDQNPNHGFMARSLMKIFDELETRGSEYSVRISHLGIANEELIDLLSTRNEEIKLKLVDDNLNKGIVIVNGLEDIFVHDINRALQMLNRGCKKKHNLNLPNSSRSHGVFTVTVHFKKNNCLGEEHIHVGKLNFVDLASSEIIGGSLDSLRDLGKSNQSLLTLSRVITSLAENSGHIPYRESKLTRLLQDSLGGSTKTCIVATVSSGLKDLDETLNTLNLMSMARNISNKPQQNKQLSSVSLKWYAEELSKLQRELEACRGNEGFYITADGYSELLDKIKILTEEKQQAIKKITVLTTEHNVEKEKFIHDIKNLYKKNDGLTNTIKQKQEQLMYVLQKYSDNSRNFRNFIENSFTHEKSSENLEILKGRLNKISEEFKHELIDLELSMNKEHEEKNQAFKNNVSEILDCICCKFTLLSNENKLKNASVTLLFNNIKNQYEEQLSLYEKKIDLLSKRNDDIRTCLFDMKKEHTDVLNDLMSQLNSLKENFNKIKKVIEDDTIEDQIIKISHCTQANFNSIRDLNSQLLKTIEKIGNLKEIQQNTTSHSQEIKQYLNHNSEYVNNALANQTEICQKLDKNLLMHKENIDSNCINVVEEEMKKIQDNLMDKSTVMEEYINQIKKAMEFINDTCGKIINCVSIEEIRSRDKSRYIEEISDNISEINIIKTDITSQIEILPESTIQLTNKELKYYTQTGDTPKRKDYNFHQEFTCTSPQERLRERFRRNVQ